MSPELAALSLCALELQPREACIKSAGGGERLVRAFFDDAAFVHYQDAVARENRRQPMRDHDRGALAHQIGQRGGNLRFAFGVERRGGFVEQQERRVAQNGARNRDALALTAGELDAAFADRRVVAVR